MKPRPATTPGPLACAALLLLALALCAPAAAARQASQARQQQPTPQPTPARPAAANSNAGGAGLPRAAAQIVPATREARARAYVKLLEGQRHVARARSAGGISREGLAAAQNAFRQAAELDPSLAEAHTALAELAFFFTEDQAEAERAARAALKIDPDNYGAHRLLARLYSLRAGTDPAKLNRAAAESAIAELKEVLRLDPNDPEALALVGEFYHLTGREAEAIEVFRRWVSSPPTVDTRFYQIVTQGGELSPDAAWARLAQSLLEAGRAAEAIEALRQALSSEPENARYLQLLGRAVEQGGESGTAGITELKRLSSAFPDNASMSALLARTLARAGRVDEAAATLRTAIAKREGRDQEQLVEALSQLLADAMRHDEAVAAYNDLLKARGIADAALTTDADKQLAANYLGRIINLQREAGNYDAALATVGRARRMLGQGDALADYYGAAVLREQGKRREALEAVRAARLRHPEHPALIQLEASTLADLGQVEEAARLLRARLSGNPEDDFSTHLAIAGVYLEAGRGKEAVEAARKLVESTPVEQPRMTQALIMLSSAQERAGDLKGAEESLRRILAREPDNATALNNLGYFLAERGERLPEALDLIRRAVRAEPANASFLDSLGWAHFKLGQLDEAERYLSDAARRSPRSATIHEHLGDLHQRRGKLEEARASWRKALSLSVEPAETARLKAKIGGETRK